jgi:hypothetical protein
VSLPEMNDEETLTLLIVLVELVETVMSNALEAREGISKTYDQLVSWGWFHGALLRQVPDDFDGTLEFLLDRHSRMSR